VPGQDITPACGNATSWMRMMSAQRSAASRTASR
jgi:hypothetical protein